MNKTFEQIKQEIEREFIGGRYDGISATEEILTNIVGQSVKHYDTKISDGVDEDETDFNKVFGADGEESDADLFGVASSATQSAAKLSAAEVRNNIKNLDFTL